MARARKVKLGKTKPATQLFLFSNKLATHIDSFFSGCVVVEIELSKYDYKYHDEAKQVVDFMNVYCKSRSLKPFRYLTVVINYKPSGLTLADLSGEYEYSVAVHGLSGYKQLASVHTAYTLLERRLASFQEYASITNTYIRIAKNQPISLTTRSSNAIKNQLVKTQQSILKSLYQVVDNFHSNFKPTYNRKLSLFKSKVKSKPKSTSI